MRDRTEEEFKILEHWWKEFEKHHWDFVYHNNKRGAKRARVALTRVRQNVPNYREANLLESQPTPRGEYMKNVAEKRAAKEST